MPQYFNEFGQPIGAEIAGWAGCKPPSEVAMEGRFCRLEALNAARHGGDLFKAYQQDSNGSLWTYMASGPFDTEVALTEWIAAQAQGRDPLFYAIIERANGKAVGMASYMRMMPRSGVIEVGNIAYSPLLQRTALATEAMFLMMVHIFDDLGYRRYEWKCDSLNGPSRRAAERYGFTHEGIFRQALVYKGRNRDTAWFSVLDREWPTLKKAYTSWLDPENFSSSGQQKNRLADLIAALRHNETPER
uniref:GNAT family N-acetyltransferase n=1 Tax=Pararhizobium sp. IMCC3301 TaxID=3067904 RepID=UPI002741C1BE|nr:GNAT family protein [Pararhizobium sp. IMCC3301]